MATYTRREWSTRHVEYAVPAEQPWGACWVEVDKAIVAATVEYRQRHFIPDDALPADDWLRVYPGDDEILIRFEVEEPANG